MEILIVEFLVGVLAGTVSGLLIVRRSGNTTMNFQRAATSKTTSSKTKVTQRQATKTRDVTQRRIHARHSRRTRPSDSKADVSPKGSELAIVVVSCPTCGLQAPEGLMAEHFLGSPSHKDKPIEPLPQAAHSENTQAAPLSEMDSRDSLRSLLQMLVPPRAFGRRHGQRSVDPLANIVQTIEGSRNTPTR